MKAFLIFLIVASAAAYGFLAALHGLLPPANSGYAATDQTEVHRSTREAGSWGTYLPASSASRQSAGSNAVDEPSRRDAYARERPGMGVPTPGEVQVVSAGEPVRAPEAAASPEMHTQPSASSTPAYSTAKAEHISPKTAALKRKARGRAKARPSYNISVATNGPQSVRPAPDSQQRGLGFFLFGRFAARD